MRWLVVAALCLPACKGKQAPAPKRDDAAVLPADASLPDAAVDAAPPDAPGLATTITADGVGPITAKATDEDDFAKLLPGFKISSEHHEAEDYSYDEITATKDGKPMLRAVVTSSGLFKIVVLDPMFATTAGVAVGTTVEELAVKIKDTTCVFETYDPQADAERVERALRCKAPSLENVAFEIDHDKYKGKEGKVAVKAIAARKIIEIVWLADEP